MQACRAAAADAGTAQLRVRLIVAAPRPSSSVCGYMLWHAFWSICPMK